jgi:hypothetical protein
MRPEIGGNASPSALNVSAGSTNTLARALNASLEIRARMVARYARSASSSCFDAGVWAATNSEAARQAPAVRIDREKQKGNVR